MAERTDRRGAAVTDKHTPPTRPASAPTESRGERVVHAALERHSRATPVPTGALSRSHSRGNHFASPVPRAARSRACSCRAGSAAQSGVSVDAESGLECLVFLSVLDRGPDEEAEHKRDREPKHGRDQDQSGDAHTGRIVPPRPVVHAACKSSPGLLASCGGGAEELARAGYPSGPPASPSATATPPLRLIASATRARLLTMICLSIAVKAGVLIVSPW
jgi:hypothetical protein